MSVLEHTTIVHVTAYGPSVLHADELLESYSFVVLLEKQLAMELVVRLQIFGVVACGNH